jgi:hypothetical protein
LRLGAAIQLGFVRLTGTTLDAFDYVPRAVLDLVGRQLELPAPQLATLRAIYRRERTLFAHQAWACAYAGFRWAAPADLEGLDASLIAFADVSVERPRLARHAREYLYSHGCLISRARDIDRRVRRAVLAVEATDVQRVEALADAQLRATWIPRLLREMEPRPLTVLEWLRRAPKKRSPTTLRDAVSKLHALRSLWPVTGPLRIPAGRLRVYAQRMARRRPAKLREITEPRRTLEIASLLCSLCSLVSRQSDIVLQLIEMRINALWSRAQAHVEADPLPAVPDAIALELFRAAADESISDADYRARARQLLVPWGEAAQQARSSRAAKVRAKLVKNWRRLRALLKLVLPLKLCAQSGDEMAVAFRELETCYAHGWTDLWTEATTPSGRAWQTLIQSPDREQAFKAYEAATLWGLRRGAAQRRPVASGGPQVRWPAPRAAARARVAGRA